MKILVLMLKYNPIEKEELFIPNFQDLFPFIRTHLNYS